MQLACQVAASVATATSMTKGHAAMNIRVLIWFICIALILTFPRHESPAQWEPNGTPICTTTSFQSVPQITTTGYPGIGWFNPNGPIITWADRRNGDDDIYAMMTDPWGGSTTWWWSPWPVNGEPVCTTAAVQRYPTIASSGEIAVIAWEDFRNGNFDIYGALVNQYGVSTANGAVICNQAGDQRTPVAVTDGAFGAIVVWTDYRTFGLADIYAQRAGGTPWTPANGRVVCALAGNQINFAVIPDGAGGIIVAWEDSRSGLSNYDIYAQRLSPAGNLMWDVNAEPVCTAASLQTEVAIAPAGSLGAIIAWRDRRSGDDIYAQRVAADGTMMWAIDGVPICTATGTQNEPLAVPHTSDGAIIVWTDDRSGTSIDIYAQCVNDTGGVVWSPDGVPVCTDTTDQYNVAVAPDNHGGVGIIWVDERGDDQDIYAQHIDANGTASWAIDGIAVCDAANDQYSPAIAADSSTLAFDVAWTDTRDDPDGDIYGSRIHLTGYVPVGVGSPARGTYLTQNYPNPFNPTTTIEFQLPASMHVELSVHRVDGRLVTTLADRTFPGGANRVVWNGTNSRGVSMSSGVYFYRLHAGSAVLTKKMVLLK